MERVGFTMRLLPGQEAEYRRRHAAVWPEMLEALRVGGRTRLFHLHPRLGSVCVSRGRGFRGLPRNHGRRAGQRALAGRDGRADRPADRPGDGFSPASRGDLPPRLSDRWRPVPPSRRHDGSVACVRVVHHPDDDREPGEMSEQRPDVIVVGGGIVGASAAAFLADGGARVTIVERQGLASGASGANSGVVQHPFDLILAALYRETARPVPGPVHARPRLPVGR